MVADGGGPWSDRGAFNQKLARKVHYRVARRLPLTDTVFFEAWKGRQYSDNPRAVFEELVRRGDPRRLVWAVEDHGVEVPDGVETVVNGSRAYFRALGRARWVVSNDSMPKHYAKRDGSRYGQTWHGTPLKRIGFDIENLQMANKDYLKQFAKEVAKWDALVSPNPTRPRSSGGRSATTARCSRPGTRATTSSTAAEDRAARTAAVRERLGIEPGKRVILYAPTWRDNQYDRAGRYQFAMKLDLERMYRRFKDDAVLLIRGHQLVAGSVDTSMFGGFARNVSYYPDISDLYLVGRRPGHRLLLGDVRLRQHRPADAVLHPRPRGLPRRPARLLLRLRGRGARARCSPTRPRSSTRSPTSTGSRPSTPGATTRSGRSSPRSRTAGPPPGSSTGSSRTAPDAQQVLLAPQLPQPVALAGLPARRRRCGVRGHARRHRAPVDRPARAHPVRRRRDEVRLPPRRLGAAPRLAEGRDRHRRLLRLHPRRRAGRPRGAGGVHRPPPGRPARAPVAGRRPVRAGGPHPRPARRRGSRHRGAARRLPGARRRAAAAHQPRAGRAVGPGRPTARATSRSTTPAPPWPTSRRRCRWSSGAGTSSPAPSSASCARAASSPTTTTSTWA